MTNLPLQRNTLLGKSACCSRIALVECYPRQEIKVGCHTGLIANLPVKRERVLKLRVRCHQIIPEEQVFLRQQGERVGNCAPIPEFSCQYQALLMERTPPLG